MNALKSKLLNNEIVAPSSPPPIGQTAATSDVSHIPPKPAPVNPVKIMVSIPSGRTWESRTATAVTGLVAFSALQGLHVGVINLEGSMITKQRNDLVDNARKHGADYILFVDSDMVFPPDALLRLLKHGKDIVGATYNKRVPPYETLGKLMGPQPSEAELAKGGLRQAELLPGGMMLVKLSVYDRIRWPWYYESYQWPGTNGVEALKNFLRDNFGGVPEDGMLAQLDQGPLSDWLNAVHEIENKTEWKHYSEDLSFCRKCRKAGIEMWCDLDLTYSCVHLGVLEVTCKMPEPSTRSVVVPATM